MKGHVVRDWMSSEPVTVAPDIGIGVAHQIMRLNDVRRLPVVDDEDKLVGLVTLSDVREAKPGEDSGMPPWEAHLRLATVEVRDIMSPMPHTVAPDRPILEAARIMLNEKVGSLPVVEDDRLIGIITESDMFRMLVREYEADKASS